MPPRPLRPLLEYAAGFVGTRAQFRQQVAHEDLARRRLLPSDLFHRYDLVIQVVTRHEFEGAAGHDEVFEAKHARAVDQGVGRLLRFGQRALGLETPP